MRRWASMIGGEKMEEGSSNKLTLSYYIRSDHDEKHSRIDKRKEIYRS